jgi:hypothetical protein
MADYISGANGPQGKQRPLARRGLLPVSFSCRQIELIETIATGNLLLNGNSGSAIQPAKGKS